VGGTRRGGTIELNSWTHVACSWDGTTLKGFINGDRRLNLQGMYSGPSTNSNPLVLGESFTGGVDTVRIYNAALSEAEICALAGGSWSGSTCSS